MGLLFFCPQPLDELQGIKSLDPVLEREDCGGLEYVAAGSLPSRQSFNSPDSNRCCSKAARKKTAFASASGPHCCEMMRASMPIPVP